MSDGSPRNLVVMGDSGAGKTKVACAILAESATHVPCRFATFGDVLRSVRECVDYLNEAPFVEASYAK